LRAYKSFRVTALQPELEADALLLVEEEGYIVSLHYVETCFVNWLSKVKSLVFVSQVGNLKNKALQLCQ